MKRTKQPLNLLIVAAVQFTWVSTDNTSAQRQRTTDTQVAENGETKPALAEKTGKENTPFSQPNNMAIGEQQIDNKQSSEATSTPSGTIAPSDTEESTLVQPELQGTDESPSDEKVSKDIYRSTQTGIGLVAAAGLHTGLALGARLGVSDVGLEIIGGYQLLLVISEDRYDRKGSLDAGSSAQFGTELYVTPWHPIEKSSIGIKSGYRYNTVLKHGFSIAIAFLVDLSSELALEGLAGGSFFIDKEDLLRKKLKIPSGNRFLYSSAMQFFEYGFELIWYPW